MIPTFKIQEYYTTDQPRGSEPKYIKNLKGKRGISRGIFHQNIFASVLGSDSHTCYVKSIIFLFAKDRHSGMSTFVLRK